MNKKITLRQWFSIGFAAMMISILSFSAQAVPIVMNGSFENATSPFSGPPYPLGSPNFEIPLGPQTNLANWTVTNPAQNTTGGGFLDCLVLSGFSSAIHVCGGGFELWLDPGESPFDKGNYIAFDGDSTIAHSIFQDINDLVIGQFYNINFSQAAGQLSDRTGDTQEWWDVSLGLEHHDSPVMNNQSMSFVAWNQQTLTFKATNTTETLRFLARGTPNGLPPFVLLDGVSITAVPEPATLALMGMGLAGLLLGRRQSKKRI